VHLRRRLAANGAQGNWRRRSGRKSTFGFAALFLLAQPVAADGTGSKDIPCRSGTEMVFAHIGETGLLSEAHFGVAALGKEEGLAGQGTSPLRGCGY